MPGTNVIKHEFVGCEFSEWQNKIPWSEQTWLNLIGFSCSVTQTNQTNHVPSNSTSVLLGQLDCFSHQVEQKVP